MKIVFLLTAGLIALGLPQAVLAQTSPIQNANRAVQITEARKANGALMKQYSWKSRIELMEGGAVKDIRVEQVNYGPDGMIRRTILNDQKSPLPGGFLRRAIAENDREKLEDYLPGLRGLLDQYTLPTAGKILDFMNQATTTGPDPSGEIQMTGSGVVLPGDTLTIWSDAKTRQTRKIGVTTFYKGDVVLVTATFETVPGGLTHVDYAEATIAAKQLSVQVQNYNYVRNPPPAAAVQKAGKGTPPGAASKGGSSLQVMEKQLRNLKALLDQGLITQNDYDAKKAQILQNL